ncbi:MAG: hypothetical protein AABW81_04145, partial [Nanoarchaeota archaeon]
MKNSKHKLTSYERRSQLYRDILMIPPERLEEEILSFSYGDFKDFFGVDKIVRAMASRLNDIDSKRAREVMAEYHTKLRTKEKEAKEIWDNLP